jgi:hypothetical protein
MNGIEYQGNGTLGFNSGLRVDTNKRYSNLPKMPDKYPKTLFAVEADSRSHIHEFESWVADKGYHQSQFLALLRLSLQPAVKCVVVQQMKTQTYEEMVNVLLTAYGSGGVPVKEQQDATSFAQELTCEPNETAQKYAARVCMKLGHYQQNMVDDDDLRILFTGPLVYRGPYTAKLKKAMVNWDTNHLMRPFPDESITGKNLWRQALSWIMARVQEDASRKKQPEVAQKRKFEKNAKEKQSAPCKYFLLGTCRKGDDCAFPHVKKDASEKSEGSRSSILPAKQTCTFCKKTGHKEEECFSKHPSKRPKNRAT